MEDIMVKTAPADPDFQINNVSELINRVKNSPPEGYFVIAPGYLDILSKNNPFQPLLAHRAKLSFSNYTILFDLEVLPDAPAKSMNFQIF